MDAAFFAVKQAHLAGTRFCTRLLARYGLTPARFDMLVAVADRRGITQRDLRFALGVARSTASEMVAELLALGLLARSRAHDRRTFWLELTERGRALYARAYEELINGGLVPLVIDQVLSEGEPEVDTELERYTLISTCLAFQGALGRAPPHDVYMWHPDDYLDAFTKPGRRSDEVPFVQ
jgi:DNA-binding MarR family transcriptional regulator